MDDPVEEWRRAVLEVEVPGGLVHPAELAQVRDTTVFVITAHNPGAVVQGHEGNREADEALAAELERLDFEAHRVSGWDPASSHVEHGWALLGIDRDQARSLGAAYGQRAIYEVRAEAILIVWCEEDRILDITPGLS